MPAFVAEGIVAIAGYFGTEITLATAMYIAEAAIVVGSMAYSYEQQRAAAKKAKDAYNASQVDRMANVVTTMGQRELVLGRVRKGGTVFGRASTGTNHTNLYIAIALAAHEIDGIDAVYFNDVPVTLDGSGNVTSAPYSLAKRTPHQVTFTGNSVVLAEIGRIDSSSVVVTRDDGAGVDNSGSTVIGSSFDFTTATVSLTTPDGLGGVVTYQSIDSVPKARVFMYFGGSGQAVSAPLNSAFGTDWPTTSTATGVAYLVCEFTYDDTAFPSGPPAVSAVVRGAKVYDPRTGTTAFSENPALLMRHVLTHPQFGKRSSLTAAEDARIIAAANACDTSVTYTVGGVGTTRPLFTAGTVLPYGNPAKACLDDLAQAMGGMWAYAGGQFYVKAGVYTAPVLSLTDADLAVVKTDNSGQKTQQAITIGTHQARASKVNVITPRIWDSAQDYKEVALSPLVASALVTRDGCWLAQEVTMPAVTYSAQALHIAGITIRDARDPLTVTLPFKMTAYPLELFDSITLTIPRYGWSAKEFMILGRQWTLDGLIQLTLKETASAIFQMDAAFSAQGYATNTNLPTPWSVLPPSNVVVASGPSNLELQADGTVAVRVKVSWDAITDSSILNGGTVEVQYRLASQTVWQSLSVPGTATFAYIYGANPGDVGFVQVRTKNRVAVSDFCTMIAHTVTGKSAGPGTPTGFTATGIAQGIHLSCTLPTDVDLAYVELWRNTSNNLGTATKIAEGLRSTYDDPGLTAANGTLWYWVRAVNTTGIAGSFAGPVSAVAGLTTVPGSVTGLTATGIEHGIRLSGTLPTDPDLAYVEVWEGTTNVLGSATLIDKGLRSSYDRVGLTAASGTRYYWVRCVNTSGTAGSFVGPVSAVAGITTTPGTVTGLTATSIIGGIRITGTLPSDTDLATVLLYTNTVNNSGTATLLATGLTDHYDHVGLLPTSGTHYYWAKCQNTSGTIGAFSSVASAVAGTASAANISSVTWSTVSGTGRPADNADVTTSILANSGTSVTMTSSNLFKTTTGVGGVFIGGGGITGKDSGGNVTFALDGSTGAASFAGNITGGANISITGTGRFNGAYSSSIGIGAVVANDLYGAANGVVGYANVSNGAGVYGYNSNGASAATAYGVYGESLSVNAAGVYGYCPTAGGTGVRGTAVGTNSLGGDFSSGYNGVQGSGANGGYGVKGMALGGGPGVWCYGTFQWGLTYTYPVPGGTAVKYMRDDGTWTDPLGGKTIGNASGNVPVSNGTANTNLNADMVDGFHASHFTVDGTGVGTTINGFSSGSMNATFNGTATKPGTNNTTNSWLTINIGGTLYDFPVWPR
jgi:hypothetical protein